MPLFDLNDHGDLDGGVEREGPCADSHTSMTTTVAKHFDEQIGTAVNHGRLLREMSGAIHEPFDADDAFYFVQRAQLLAQRGEKGERGLASGMLTFSDADAGANFAGDHLPLVVARNVSGEEEQISRSHHRHVIGDRRCGLWQRDVKILQIRFGRPRRGGGNAQNSQQRSGRKVS
jgi:hypothetical protein